MFQWEDCHAVMAGDGGIWEKKIIPKTVWSGPIAVEGDEWPQGLMLTLGTEAFPQRRKGIETTRLHHSWMRRAFYMSDLSQSSQ